MAWKQRAHDETYSDDEIEARLREQLPRWSLECGWICRRYRTAGWKSTLMVVNAVGHLAEAAFHHPELSASYGSVTIRLMTHSAAGVTNKDFELAAKIEAVVLWRPGTEEGALEGTPQDPRFQYLKYE